MESFEDPTTLLEVEMVEVEPDEECRQLHPSQVEAKRTKTERVVS